MAQPPRDRDGGPDRRRPRFELGDLFPPDLREELELTPDQERKLSQLSSEVKGRLEKLLTAEQQKRVSDFRPRRPGGPNDRPERSTGRNGASTRRESNRPLKELPPGVTRVPVSISGGHETDERDHGRPVTLIAAALGVSSEVFRDAFKKVKPAPEGTEPEPGQVRRNKEALLQALGQHGVTNDRLDEVSNFYRYRPGRDSLWKHQDAVVNGLVKAGKIIGYEIVDAGAGYTTSPKFSIDSFPDEQPKARLSFGTDLESNGSIASIGDKSDR